MWLFVLFLGIPLIEIALFVVVGGWIGLWATLAVVLGSGVLGVSIIRRTGLRAMTDLQRELQTVRAPMGPIADRVAVIVAGILLILPGFFTDTLGLLLLIPPLRAALIAAVAVRVTVATTGFGAQARRGAEVIDGEYFELAPESDQGPENRAENRLPPAGRSRY